MIFTDLDFRDYYHCYAVFEADALTERLDGTVRIGIDDCFVLCSSYVAKNGQLTFNALSVGRSWEKCDRGLARKKMLGSYLPDELENINVRLIRPDERMIAKNQKWIEHMESLTDPDLMETRMDARLDNVRDNCWPDHVKVGILMENGIHEYEMRILRFNGPFVEGRLIDLKKNEGSLRDDELVRALPYMISGEYRLLAVFVGDHLTNEQKTRYQQLIAEGSKAGFGFSVPGSMRS
ncbi:MAG: hypothetical protein EOM64_00360 [Erysipelotrichia bacterium]|nr:hypothetical protein [Erysipelotrichia bacterium]